MMADAEELTIVNEVKDQCTTGQPFTIEEFSKDSLYKFTYATTAYGWVKPFRLRPYQIEPAWNIMLSVIGKEGREIVCEFARQSGKTYGIPGAMLHFLSALPSMFEPLRGGFRAGIFGPKKEQAVYAFDVYKEYLETQFLHDYLGVKTLVSNSKEVRLSNGVRIHCESASINANIERLTLDLALLEESQRIDDTRLLNSIYPMCASTNGTRVLTGNPIPERLGYFYQISSRGGPNVYVADWTHGAKYSKDYKNYVEKEMKQHGRNSDYFKTQYDLLWVTNTVNFCTMEELSALRFGPLLLEGTMPVVAGLDTARITDSTVLTIMALPTREFKPHICMWHEWQGDNYVVQALELQNILKNFTNIEQMNVDTLHGGAYGILDQLPENIPVRAMPMEPYIQDRMWTLLREAIVNQLFTYPEVTESERYRFEEQMTMLKTTYKNRKFKVEAMSGKHDDYADSLALCWMAIAEGSYGISDNAGANKDSDSISANDVEEERKRIRPKGFSRPKRIT